MRTCKRVFAITAQLVSGFWCIVSPPVALAQETSHPGCAAEAPSDTTLAVALGHLDVVTPGSLSRAYLDDFLTGLGATLIGSPVTVRPIHLLDPILITAMAGRVSGKNNPGRQIMPVWPGRPELTGEFQFTIDRSGFLRGIIATHGDSAINARLVHALTIVRADSFPEGAVSDTVDLRLRLSLAPDSTADASQPLVELAEVGNKSTAAACRAGNPGPRYPDRERMRDIEAVVLVWLDVDERGRPVINSFGAARSNAKDTSAYRPFVESVRNAMRSYRFYPARVNGCVVRQRVMFGVSFKVAG